jgi:hypothetical protein
VLRGARAAMTKAWSTQPGLTWWPLLQLIGLAGDAVPTCDHAADLQAPGGVKVIAHPIIALHTWQALGRSWAVCHAIGGRAGAPAGPEASWPVAPAQAWIRTRVPWRLYACSRRSHRPGGAGLVGAWRSRMGRPVFSSPQITTRPCWEASQAGVDSGPRGCALASQSASWLLSQSALWCGVRSASWRRRWPRERRRGVVPHLSSPVVTLLSRPMGHGAVLRWRQCARDGDDVDTCRRGHGSWASRAASVWEPRAAQDTIAPSPFAHREGGPP